MCVTQIDRAIGNLKFAIWKGRFLYAIKLGLQDVHTFLMGFMSDPETLIKQAKRSCEVFNLKPVSLYKRYKLNNTIHMCFCKYRELNNNSPFLAALFYLGKSRATNLLLVS